MTEFNAGSVYIEVELMLSSDSGRDKHVSLDEQAGWLTSMLGKQIAKLGEIQGVGVGKIKNWGATRPVPGAQPVREYTLDDFK